MDPYAGMRRILLMVLGVGILGTGTELILLEHYEDVWQWAPLVGFGLGLISLVAVLVRPTRGVLRTFQLVMLLFVAAGATGVYLHYTGNAEFELEMVPALRGLELFWKSIRGATPALAPGSMAEFGLLGLASTYRHPLLRGNLAATPEPSKEAQ